MIFLASILFIFSFYGGDLHGFSSPKPLPDLPPIETPFTLEKALKKTEKYLNYSILIKEALFRYCQLCSDIPTTYSLKLQTYFGEQSTQYETLTNAYMVFSEDINPLIDTIILPRIDLIQEELKKLQEEISQNQHENYQASLLIIKQELNNALKPIEEHIIKVGQVLGLKSDLLFKIASGLRLTKKSYFSLQGNPNTYLKKTKELIQELHERIEYTLTTKATNPAQKLYMATIKNPEFEKFANKAADVGDLFSILFLQVFTAWCVAKNKNPLLTQAQESVQKILRIWTPRIITKEDEQQLQRLNASIPALSTSHFSHKFSSFYTNLSRETKEKILNGDNALFHKAINLLEYYQNNIQEQQANYANCVGTVAQTQCAQLIHDNFKKFKEKHDDIIEYLKKFKQALHAKKHEEFDREKLKQIAELELKIDIFLKEDSRVINSAKLRNKLLEDHEEKKFTIVETLEEKENILKESQNLWVQLKEIGLLIQLGWTLGAVACKALQKAKPHVEKILFHDQQDRLEKIGMHKPFGMPDTVKRQEEKKNQEWIKSQALVKPKVTFDQVIGREEIIRKLQAQIQYCKDPLLYRDTKLQPIILCGEPGTGKTFTAEAIADACGRNLYKLTPDMIDYQTLRSLFDALEEDSPCVLLIDEAHRYFRMNEKGQMDRDAALFHSFVVPRLNEARNKFRKFLVIFATNTPTMLATDLWRRCNEVWLVPPTLEQRCEVIEKYLEQNDYFLEKEEYGQKLLHVTHGMNFDDLNIILDTIKNNLIRSKENTISEDLINKGLKAVYQHKLQAITFSPSLSRNELLEQFIATPYKIFKKYIEEWKEIRRPLKRKDIHATTERIKKQKLAKKK